MARPCDLALLEAAFTTSLAGATPETQEELRRIARYRAPPPAIDYPKQRLAAVLVLLHLDEHGELAVTLTTRSSRLRSHPGETALPGGRWEEGDGEGGEWTALREAYEEIGLPLPLRRDESGSDRPESDVPLLYLTSLPAFTSRTLLVVLPIVYLLLQPADSASSAYLPSFLRPNPDEVDAIFHLPLRSFLHLPESEGTSTKRTRFSYDHADYTWLLSRPYRLHAFSSAAPAASSSDPEAASEPHSAVTGLTADIVIDTALLAHYGTFDEVELPPRAVGFERRAKGQMEWSEIVEEALKVQKNGVGGIKGDASHETGLGAKLGGADGIQPSDTRSSAT